MSPRPIYMICLCNARFCSCAAKAKVVRAPPKKIVQPTKMAKPTIGKTKVTQSVVSVTTSKQAQSKPASGSSKTVARSELSKTTIKKPNVKSGSPVQSSTKSVNGSAVAAHSAEKGPAPAPKKIAATSSGGSKTSKSGPPRRRVHFPGQVCFIYSVSSFFVFFWLSCLRQKKTKKNNIPPFEIIYV